MPNLRYEIARLKTDYYLHAFSSRAAAHRKIPSPAYVIWDCTRRCNLACVHCGATKERYDHELDSGQTKAILDQLAGMGAGMFAVTGGEPLLREDLPEILAYAGRRGLKTGIATNGFLIDRPMSVRLKEAGVHSIQVSLDGLEERHNLTRNNRQSFARAVRAIELLFERKTPLLSVATTVTPQNLSELEGLKGILLQLGVRLWRLTVVMPIGRAQSTDLLLTGERLTSLFEFVKKNDSRDLHIYLGENLTFLGEWERQIRNAPAICPIGFTACCIGVDGHVRGCPEQPDTAENREGSLLDSPLARIWQNGFQRYRSRVVLTSDENCARCAANLECLGGCWVMREQGQHCILRLLS